MSDHRGTTAAMVAARQILMTAVVTAAIASPGWAWAADSKLPQIEGANELMKLTASAGFVDDVAAVSSDNQRLAYVVADTSPKAEVHVVQFGCAKCADNKQEIVVDVSAVTLRPTQLRLVGANRVFVIGAAPDGSGNGNGNGVANTQVAALFDLATKKPVYKLGPAVAINVMKADNTQRVFAHFVDVTPKGEMHHIEKFSLENGKRLMKAKGLELVNGYEKRIGLKVNHWDESWTRAVGLKDGAWVKKEDQRSPDTEAIYDLKLGRYVVDKPVTDLFEQRKRFASLADSNGTADFLRMAADNGSIQLWHAGQVKTIELDQPLASYDPKSLQGVVNADGSEWVALEVDPVNVEAVARKKADPEYLDVFKVGADGKAVRKARVLGKGVRFRFGVLGVRNFWLLERSPGSDRGGRALTIYSFAS
jgi:hypothetical protein